MIRYAALFALLPLSAVAGGTLEGRIVTLNVETWDTPREMIFASKGHTVKVGGEVEFGMGPEFRTPGFDVVPVQVEITPSRIEFSYGADAGQFWSTTFNGYVLRFVSDCALIQSVAVDAAFTTMEITDTDIRHDGTALYINVTGRAYGPDKRLGLDLSVGDCLLG